MRWSVRNFLGKGEDERAAAAMLCLASFFPSVAPGRPLVGTCFLGKQDAQLLPSLLVYVTRPERLGERSPHLVYNG